VNESDERGEVISEIDERGNLASEVNGRKRSDERG